MAAETDAATQELLYWLSNSGVRFGVDATREVRSALGLSSMPSPAPWAARRLLAPGPKLSDANALSHDTDDDDLPAGGLAQRAKPIPQVHIASDEHAPPAARPLSVDVRDGRAAA